MIQQLLVSALIVLTTGLAVLTVLCLRSYLALKKQVSELAANNSDAASVPEKLAEMREQLKSFSSRLDELDKRKSIPAAAPLPAPPNLNRRGQVMRLYRSGESTSSIASAFGVSQGEVELMVKVQELLSENTSGETSSNSL